MTDRPIIYHGTPLTPRSALNALIGARAWCASFFRPDDADYLHKNAGSILWDNGAFSFWMDALRRGEEWNDDPRDWAPYYAWLERRLFSGRLAIIPDMPGAPSQLNDALLAQWPFCRELSLPLFHMDGPLSRLGRLCENYDMVALGWIGDPKREPVGCDRYRHRMDEIAEFFGNRWHPTHMLRGIAVAFDYPFVSADSTSLAQNGHRYDSPLDTLVGTPWRGRIAYADRLEGVRGRLPADSRDSRGRRRAPRTGLHGYHAPQQPGLW